MGSAIPGDETSGNPEASAFDLEGVFDSMEPSQPTLGYILKATAMSFHSSPLALVMLLCLSVASAFCGPATPAPELGFTPGTAWVGAAGIHRRAGDISQQSQHGRRVGRIQLVHKLADVEYPEKTASPVSPVTAVDGGPAALVAGTGAQTVSNTFLGATLADCQAYPPDTMGAVGPSQFIVAVNGRIRSFNKATGVADGAVNSDTDAFFSSVMTPPANNNFTSDPRIRYDRLSRRWFIIIIDVPGQTGALPNRVLMAVSDGPRITSGSSWTFYQFQHDLVSPAGNTGQFADYPTLGIDANALYIGVNLFTSAGSFANTTAFVVRKSSLLNGGPIVVTAFRNLIPNGNSGGLYTPQGVDNFDPNATEGYLIGVNNRFFGRLVLRRISNPGGTPSSSGNTTNTLPVSNGGTIAVPHLGNTGGTAGNLDGLDYRLLAAHLRNGRLWTAENIGVDNTGSASGTDTRMGVRWYELGGIPTGQTPTVLQSGTLFEASASNTTTNRCYWMGSVMVSGQGHAAMGFSVAGANEFVNAGTCGRLVNDPVGRLRAPQLYTTSGSAYNPRDGSGNPIERWGDYSYTCLDPDDDMTMWTIQEWCSSPNYYGVQIAKLLAPAPATPLTCHPSTVTNGAVGVSVTLTGLSNGDTGFFDPGTGFSNRIAAAISGSGLTVNSVLYNNPTNVILNLTVAGGAVTGARIVRVTNPDGQQASSAGGILTVVAAAAVSNQPPVLAVISNQIINEEQTLVFTNSATDPDGNALTFSLDPGAPTNATIAPVTGVFSWAPTEAQGPSTNSITVRATDNGVPNLSATSTFIVFVNEVNVAPGLSPVGPRTVVEGTLLVITNVADDSDMPANTLTFSLANAPSNAVINASSGVFSWQTTEVDGPGTNTISVIVTDDGVPSLSATNTFTVMVLETNSAPTLEFIADRVVHAGSLIQFTNVAADADLPANVLWFSLQSGAPAGATVGAINGVFNWQTSEAEAETTNSITVEVADDGSSVLSASRTFTATLVARPVIQSIVVSNDTVRLSWSAIVGQGYRLQTNSSLELPTWDDLGAEVIAVGASADSTDVFEGETKYYRVRVLP